MTGTPRLTELSATALAVGIRSGSFTSRQVIDAHVELLEQVNPTLNAVVVDRFAEARKDADAADVRIAQATADDVLPPLLGVPCTIKESIAFAGMPNTAGVVARRDVEVEQSAPVVRRLQEAGAIPLGLTNTSELCLWIETENRLYGRTNNAYDIDRTAGGSSGGEGAAVGSGGSPFGLGSDLTGSIRIPAFCNGVFGHKPSTGLVPTTGAWPPVHGITARMMVNGPLARRGEDVMPLLRIIAGPDGLDPEARAIPLGDPGHVSVDGLRVTIPTNAFLAPVDRELLAARDRAADTLVASGAVVEYVEMPWLRRALDLTLTALSHDVGVTAAHILESEGADPLTWRGLIARNSPHTVATRLLVAGERIAAFAPTSATAKTGAAISAFADRLTDTIGDGIMLVPPLYAPAPRHGRTVGKPWWIAPMATFNLAGLPVTQVPLGLSRAGLPLGVQVAAGHGADHLTIATALHLERALGGWKPPRPQTP